MGVGVGIAVRSCCLLRYFGLLLVLPGFKGIVATLFLTISMFSLFAVPMISTNLIFSGGGDHEKDISTFTLVADLDGNQQQRNFNSLWDAVRDRNFGCK